MYDYGLIIVNIAEMSKIPRKSRKKARPGICHSDHSPFAISTPGSSPGLISWRNLAFVISNPLLSFQTLFCHFDRGEKSRKLAKEQNAQIVFWTTPPRAWVYRRNVLSHIHTPFRALSRMRNTRCRMRKKIDAFSRGNASRLILQDKFSKEK